MADLRLNTTPLDNFVRASYPEYPIQPPWINAATAGWGIGGDELEISSSSPPAAGGSLQGTGSSGAWAYYQDLIVDDSDGYPLQCWARLAGSSYSFPFGTRHGLMATNAVGYGYLQTGGFAEIMRRYTGSGANTDITASKTAGDGVYTASYCLQLMQITATDVEIWRTTDYTDDTSWVLTGRWPDATYRDNFYCLLGATGNEDGWIEFGSGPASDWPQEFIRRPWNYMGRMVDRQNV